MNQKIHILFVDDIWCRPEKQSIIRSDYGALQRRDIPYAFHYETAEEGPGRYGIEPVLKKIEKIPELAAVILDVMFGDKGDRLGLDILEAIRGQYPTLPVLIMTSLDKNNIDVVERAMELGANEYLVKKPSIEELEKALRIYTYPSGVEADYAIWGNSPAVRQVRALIARVAIGATASVLISGESGTGKELVARAIHRQGNRRNSPFVEKNCAFEKSDLLDSDLFGHEKGSFTGADRQHQGRIERANKGVLFLDEISKMPSELQGKLLRVLETRRFQRLGGATDIDSDFQLICATNEKPEKLIEQGRLGKDLFFRIKQIDIAIPPLRERGEDIEILAELFLRRFRIGPGASYTAKSISKAAIKALTLYSWPGNIRELKNVIERAVITCRETEIRETDLPAEVVDVDAKDRIDQKELTGKSLPSDKNLWARHMVSSQLRIIDEALKASNGNATVAVKHLFPLINSPNATYLKRYIKRLSEAPWGVGKDEDLATVSKQILERIGSERRGPDKRRRS